MVEAFYFFLHLIMKSILFKIIHFFIFALLVFSCKKKQNSNQYEDAITIDWRPVQNYYKDHITTAITLLDSLKASGIKGEKTKQIFAETRIAFKKAEPYVSYLNPEVGHRANGPALPIYKEDNGKIIKPIGLQKIEESIYNKDTSEADFIREIDITKGMFINLQKGIITKELNPMRFFVATHQQLLRIISLAMAGFDTPISQLSIKETAVSLNSLLFVYNHSIKKNILATSPLLHENFIKSTNKAITYIQSHTDFLSFDRYTFIRDYLNPITRNWVQIRKESKLWVASDTSPINFDAPTFFEENSFNINYFKATTNRNPTAEQIALGKKLFFDPNISKNGTMACSTCHIPEKGYADGIVFNKDNTGKLLKRNTPTLINSVFQKGFFWDGRSSSLDNQISAVFSNTKEFNTKIHQFSNRILKDTTYIKLFKDAYGKVPVKNKETIKAIASYVATLNGFDSKFDKNIRGEIDTFTLSEKRGFNLYMGKALCATCHFIPLTNGTVPPFFKETEKEVIGVPETAANKKLDDDIGFYTMYEEEIHRGMFKTPTVRNTTLTAPYMHNGVYNTLEQVIEFYNLGGGGGLGFDLEHQTLPFDTLQLTEQEQKDLITFIHTLEDVPVDIK